MRSTGIGLTAAACFLAVFLGLAWAVSRDDSAMSEFDRRTAVQMKDHAEEHALLLTFGRRITDAGGVPVMTVLAIVGALLLWWRGHRRLALAWLLAMALGAAVNQGTKAVFARARPGAELRDEVVHERNPSFPSGHSMGSAIGYGMVAYVGLLMLHRRRAKVLTVVGVVVVVLVIGWSRVYLRAHWYSDVIAGFAIGLCWLTLCITVLRRAMPR